MGRKYGHTTFRVYCECGGSTTIPSCRLFMRRIYHNGPYLHDLREQSILCSYAFWDNGKKRTVAQRGILDESIGIHAGDFLEPFGGCGVDEGLPIPSVVKGAYGAAMACGGALAPDCVRGGSGCPGHFFCSSCILSSGPPTMWYLSQLMGGQRTMFWGCGIAGNLGAPEGAPMSAESLRVSTPSCPPLASASASAPGADSARRASVGVRTSLYDCAACALFSWIDCAKPAGSATATDLSSASALRSRLLFSRCSCSSEMAERSARTSGLSLSEMATDGGCCLKVAGGGGAGRGCASVRSTGASWATEALGVMGDTGGRFGDADSERWRERADVDEASLDEAGRGFVSTRSAGMTAT
jgi:hypothetical protein